MVFTLQRYIFRELFRVFILATIGLTLILSFGLILQPVQEYGVGPKQVLHILVYFMPITLTFVLPMAALFASALTYGRFASDNELNACRASGIGLWTLVYPGLALAILVAIANLLLSFHVMPYFVHLSESALKADAKQILFRNIQRRGFFEPPSLSGNDRSRYRIYADYADSQNDTLYGIIVVEAGRGGITKMWTAERATIAFDHHGRLNEIQLSVSNARIMPTGEGLSGIIAQSSLRQSLGSMLGDDIRFKKVDEMKQIREDLMLFEPVAGKAQEAYRQLVTELLAGDLSKALVSGGAGSYELRGPTRLVRVSATGCGLKEEQTIDLVGPIVAEEYDVRSGQLLRRLRCEKSAILHVGKESPIPGLVLDLPNARNEDESVETLHVVSDLVLPDAVRRRLGQGGVLQTVLQSPRVLGAPPSSVLSKAKESLEKEIRGTLVDIKAEMNSRLVFGIGCIPMILIGIGLGIINRGGHLLSAFGASCAPAAILIIAIVSGRQVTGNLGAQVISGITIMWAGLTFLAFVAAFLYHRLMRT